MALNIDEIKKIRDELKSASRPLIFFDDDPDGLCSYLLARKYNPACIGIRAATGPVLSDKLSYKIEENQPDLILILDKPKVDESFLRGVRTKVIWIDHHDIQAINNNIIEYYNPKVHNKKDNRPVSYWMWRITKGPSWIGAAGSISDWNKCMVKLIDKKLLNNKNKIEDIIYKSPIGEIITKMNFLLKGTNKNIQKNISALTKITDPYDLINESTPRTRFLGNYVRKIRVDYDKQLSEALSTRVKKQVYIHVFSSPRLSFVKDLANEIMVKKKARIYIIARKESDKIKFSARSYSLNLPKRIEKALKKVNGYGGGHRNACGGSIAADDWDDFIKVFTK